MAENTSAYTFDNKDPNLKQFLYDHARTREWSHVLKGARGAFLIPNDNEHDSGYGCFDIIAYGYFGLGNSGTNELQYVLCGGFTDDIAFKGDHFRTDICFPSKIIRVWNHYEFSISGDLSSIDFTEPNYEGPV